MRACTDFVPLAPRFIVDSEANSHERGCLHFRAQGQMSLANDAQQFSKLCVSENKRG